MDDSVIQFKMGCFPYHNPSVEYNLNSNIDIVTICIAYNRLYSTHNRLIIVLILKANHYVPVQEFIHKSCTYIFLATVILKIVNKHRFDMFIINILTRQKITPLPLSQMVICCTAFCSLRGTAESLVSWPSPIEHSLDGSTDHACATADHVPGPYRVLQSPRILQR